MIKFFRKIRQKLLTENKFSKYLLYAIGEIFLVVIGILIAVSISNRNENRKNNEELQKILFIVKDDLERDIAETDSLFKRTTRVKKLFLHVLGDSLTKEDIENTPYYSQIAAGYPEVIFNERGINLLKGYKENEIQLDKNLVTEILNFYTTNLTAIKIDENSLNIDYHENRKYWKENTTWYHDVFYNRDITKFIPYALNDVDFKNRVYGRYGLLYGYSGYIKDLKEFKEGAIEINELIDDYIKNN